MSEPVREVLLYDVFGSSHRAYLSSSSKTQRCTFQVCALVSWFLVVSFSVFLCNFYSHSFLFFSLGKTARTGTLGDLLPKRRNWISFYFVSYSEFFRHMILPQYLLMYHHRPWHHIVKTTKYGKMLSLVKLCTRPVWCLYEIRVYLFRCSSAQESEWADRRICWKAADFYSDKTG